MSDTVLTDPVTGEPVLLSRVIEARMSVLDTYISCLRGTRAPSLPYQRFVWDVWEDSVSAIRREVQRRAFSCGLRCESTDDGFILYAVSPGT